LELLKNIFTLEKCVFILAIDYDVVIKGLKPKYGVLTNKNEREFRSFFDKIIQVPFSMPIGSYEISEYLKTQLTTMGYLGDKIAEDAIFIDTIKQAVEFTVGHNPRSIKRLLNTLSLISCINRAKIPDSDKKELGQTEGQNENALNEPINLYLNFVLVCIQIAYPKIYNVLAISPDFTNWNESVATKQRLKPLDDVTREHLKSMDEFNDPWEQILFRICETDDHLKQNALNISSLLNCMRTKITEREKAENGNAGEESGNTSYVGDYIEHIIHLSAVTNLAANDKPEIKYNVPQFLTKNFERFQGLYGDTFHLKPEQTNKTVTSYLRFNLGEITHFDITTKSINLNIVLKISHPVFPGCHGSKKTILQGFTEKGKEALEAYKKIRDTYDEIAAKYVNGQDIRYACSRFMEETNSVYDNSLLFGLYFEIILPSVEAFEDTKVLEPMVEIVKAMYDTHIGLVELGKKWLDLGRLAAISRAVISRTGSNGWKVIGARELVSEFIIPKSRIFVRLRILTSKPDSENLQGQCEISLEADLEVWKKVGEKIRAKYNNDDFDETPNQKYKLIVPTIAIIEGENSEVIDKLVEVYQFIKELGQN
jgi:hypothetical protein